VGEGHTDVAIEAVFAKATRIRLPFYGPNGLGFSFQKSKFSEGFSGPLRIMGYGVATISRLLKIIGLDCKRAL